MVNKDNREQKVSLDPGNILFILYIAFALAFVFLALVTDGYAAVTPEEVRRGELLFKGANQAEKYTPAPHLSQEVSIYISGMTARTKLKQRFKNDTTDWQEAVYVFPLPTDSAVDVLRMQIGDRLIVGEIKEKEEAKKVYARAKAEGKKASLLSQERPNIFTMAVANIGPGEEITVEIEFSQVVGFTDGVFSLRFPMVVAPRYIPGVPLVNADENAALQFSGNGWSADTDQVPDGSRITPFVRLPQEQPQNPVQLDLELAAGFKVADITSLYHGIIIEGKNEQIQRIRFNGEVLADRDFVLEWAAEKQQGPTAALFTETVKDSHYHLLMFTPQAGENEQTAPAREMIFVLDTSGSMAGPSIEQAKKALVLAMLQLSEKDRFNVIEFNSEASMLFESPKKADKRHVGEAIAFVRRLQADGGTEMLPALDLALDGKQTHERIRQVVFLTDGSVGNERELFKMIETRLGDSRLFTVGIGSAPNSFFMSRAATIGRGSFTFIGKVDEVEKKMMLLFNKLEHPALTDIAMTTKDGAALEYFPNPIPDLYLGEPLLVSVKTPEDSPTLEISGLVQGKPWKQVAETIGGGKRPGIAGLWARKKIRTIMDSSSLGVNEEEIKQQVLSTALQYHLVSKYTSLVAVEQQVSRPSDRALQQKDLKTNMPAGWVANKVFAGRARTATASGMQIVSGLLLIVAGLFFLQSRKRGLA